MMALPSSATPRKARPKRMTSKKALQNSEVLGANGLADTKRDLIEALYKQMKDEPALAWAVKNLFDKRKKALVAVPMPRGVRRIIAWGKSDGVPLGSQYDVLVGELGVDEWRVRYLQNASTEVPRNQCFQIGAEHEDMLPNINMFPHEYKDWHADEVANYGNPLKWWVFPETTG